MPFLHCSGQLRTFMQLACIVSFECWLRSLAASLLGIERVSARQDYTQPGATVAYFGLFATHWVYFLLLQQLKRLKDRSFPTEVLDNEAQEQLLKSD